MEKFTHADVRLALNWTLQLGGRKCWDSDAPLAATQNQKKGLGWHYEKVAWSSLTNRRKRHCMLFVFKALLQKLPCYLCSLVTFKYSTYNVRSQDILTLTVRLIHTELGNVCSNTMLPTNGMSSVTSYILLFHLNILKGCPYVFATCKSFSCGNI